MSAHATSSELLASLRRHYIEPGSLQPGGVFVSEVTPNGTWVTDHYGRCDAIYCGFTATSKRLLIGHELKVSRPDWLRELKSPYKADGWATECHEFWLVVSDPGIVDEGELPDGWGLMTPGGRGGRMKRLVKAETKRNHRPAWDVVRAVLARYDTERKEIMEDYRDNARRYVQPEIRAELEKQFGPRMTQLEQTLQEHLDKIRAIEDAVGARICWEPDRFETIPVGQVSLAQLGERMAGPRAQQLAATALRYLPDSERLRGTLDQLEHIAGQLRRLAELESGQS